MNNTRIRVWLLVGIILAVAGKLAYSPGLDPSNGLPDMWRTLGSRGKTAGSVSERDRRKDGSMAVPNPPLFDELQEPSDEDSAQRAQGPTLEELEGLLEQDREAGIQAITMALASSDAEVRLIAVAAAGELTGPGVLPVLERALADPEPHIRAYAAEALADHHGVGVIFLMELALGDPNAQVRIQALEALARQGPQGRRAIEHASSDHCEEVRRRARELLAQRVERKGSGGERTLRDGSSGEGNGSCNQL